MRVALLEDGSACQHGGLCSLGGGEAIQDSGEGGHDVRLDPLVNALAKSLDCAESSVGGSGIRGSDASLELIGEAACLKGERTCFVNGSDVDGSEGCHCSNIMYVVVTVVLTLENYLQDILFDWLGEKGEVEEREVDGDGRHVLVKDVRWRFI